MFMFTTAELAWPPCYIDWQPKVLYMEEIRCWVDEQWNWWCPPVCQGVIILAPSNPRKALPWTKIRIMTYCAWGRVRSVTCGCGKETKKERLFEASNWLFSQTTHIDAIFQSGISMTYIGQSNSITAFYVPPNNSNLTISGLNQWYHWKYREIRT